MLLNKESKLIIISSKQRTKNMFILEKDQDVPKGLWSGLVSWFNGILTIVDYLMPKLSL